MAYARGPLTELQHRATAFVFACLAACTTLPHQGPQPVNSSLDLDGSWIARRFPCGGEPQDLQLTLRQREKQLTARCATKSKCAPQGALLWQGELREKTLELDDLPLTMQVDLELPSARTASLTLLSANRMILDIDESTVTLQRGTLEAVPIDAGTRPAAGAGGAGSGGRNAGDASVPAAGRGEAGKAGAGAAGAAAGGGRGGADMPSAAGSGAGGDSGTGPAPAGASGGGGNAGNGPAGGQGAAAGSGGTKPAAGDGGSSAAGEGGSDAVPPPDADAPPPPDITGRRWDCLNLLISCSCIAFPDDEVGGGVCRTKYPCCYSKLVDDNDNPDCLCEPASAGGACPDHGSSSSWRLVDWCPGQLR